MRVLSVDPGKTTGWARWSHDEFDSGEILGGLHQASAFLEDMIHYVDVFVFEKFVISSSTVKKDLTEAYTALYINGALQDLAFRYDTRIVTHTPGDKEWGLPFLKAIGWHYVGGDGHANDAAAHLLKYMSDTRQLPNDLLTKIIDLELN